MRSKQREKKRGREKIIKKILLQHSKNFQILFTFSLKKHKKNIYIKVASSASRFPSDTGAFADWVASSSTARGDDLCLGFGGSTGSSAFWGSGGGRQHQIAADHLGVFVVTPAHESLFSPSAAQIQLQQNLWQTPNQNPNPSNRSSIAVGTSAGGGSTCQDCGNQAKKDCSHRRCRTCCKSRGFECSTHVKSTWVPLPRRRERQISGGAAVAVDGSSVASTLGTKKPRLLTAAAMMQTTTNSHMSTSSTTRSLDTSSSHQDARFKESLPGYVRAPAVFKCVRVTSIDDDGEDAFAYQAMVKIGRRVFKGFLYDEGVDNGRSSSDHLAITGGENNNAGC